MRALYPSILTTPNSSFSPFPTSLATSTTGILLNLNNASIPFPLIISKEEERESERRKTLLRPLSRGCSRQGALRRCSSGVINFQELSSSISGSDSDSDSDSGSESNCNSYYEDKDFIVVNFYRFVFIEDPEEEVSKHQSFLQGLDIHGRIYLNQQGINAQYSGPSKDALAYVKWLREDQKYSDILFQVSPALSGHAFPRLKLRYKPSLVQLEGGISHLPLLEPSMRATPLTPSQWTQKLQGVDKTDEMSSWNPNSRSILLDVRNGYEWDIGHFHGAQRPDVDCFRSTSFGISQSEVNDSDPLAFADKEKTDILMYCTGGIRCDVYSAILRQRGFKNLYTLKGGVSHYLENEGPLQWIGNLFVFDSRLSLPPSAYKPEVMTESGRAKLPLKNSSFAKCYICGSRLSELRHRNCANLDCNLLFLCCSGCVEDLSGCCCVKCTNATRRRPVLPGHQRYQKWHYYRDMDLQSI